MIATPPWILDASEPCPCRSGIRFAACCKPHIPEDVIHDYDPNDLRSAERAQRAALTKYLGYVYGNTLPMIDRGPMKAAQLLAAVDIDAVGDSAMAIAYVIHQQSRSKEAVAIFDLLSDIPLPGLSERLLAEKAVFVDGVLGDEKRAVTMLTSVDTRAVRDPQLLQAILSILDFPIPTEKLALVDRILSVTKNPGQRVQYLLIKAMLLCMLDQARTAIDLIHSEATPLIRELDTAGSLYDIHMCARAVAFRFHLTRLEGDKVEAIKWYSRLEDAEFTPLGKAHLHWEIGDVHLDAKDFDKAIASYYRSLHFLPNDPVRVHLVEALARNGDTELATVRLAEVKLDSIDVDLKLEYYRAACFLASVKGDESAMRQLVEGLQALDLVASYFREVRDQMCLGLLHQLQIGINRSPASVRQTSRVLDVVRGLGRYLELKPNIMGVGINFNEIIERITKR